MSNNTLDELREMIKNRQVEWIRSFIDIPIGRKAHEARRALILPTPLFEYQDEFYRIDRILTKNPNTNDLQQLIEQCKTKRDTFYCFIIWFIHYYVRFYLNDNVSINNYYQKSIENDLSKEVVDCFDLIGYKLLVFLCKNFNQASYFRLHSKMTHDELHQRLVALNMIAVLLSLKTLPYPSYLSTLLYNENLKMPENYADHLEKSVCLPGLLSNDPVVTQMIDVRTTVKERLDQGLIHEQGKFIYRCSHDCLWMFYFVNC
mgnify:CR=1 FL=1